MTAPAPAGKDRRTEHVPPAESTGNSMRARVGDEIVVRGTAPGIIAREGEIVGVHHPDGSPPFNVHWEDTDRVTLYFPGPDAYIKHLAHTSAPDGHGA
ncbi:DUF1918 domain-containing protein [Streptomyces sp. NPDC002573]|uniref:DUF1918 domain-containing protein n=1 Tax=Streptomyces sp. NPDC002573 TaxID=3364651 RepID=UPI003681199D